MVILTVKYGIYVSSNCFIGHCHNHTLCSSFVIYHRIFTKSNMTGPTRLAGTVNHQLIIGCSKVPVSSIVSLWIVFCQTIVCLCSFDHCKLSVFRFIASNYPIEIFKSFFVYYANPN